MAKGKNANPADAHRKTMRAKELKKNKEERKKVRETVTLKKDVGPLEAEVRRMNEADKARTLDKNGKARLTELQEELDRIKKTKEDYVALHPEHRHLVYANEDRERKRREEMAKERAETSGSGSGGRGRYDEQGRLRDPTRSMYYDPVLNPFGVPPPGMPYRERPLRPDQLAKDAYMEGSDDEEDEDDDDDDIVMPEGPPPGQAEDGGSDSDDSIILPEGSPPPEARLYPPEPPKAPAAERAAMAAGQFPPGFRPPPFGFRPPTMMQNPRGNFPAVPMNGAFPPRPPNGFPPQQFQQQQQFPTPPPGFFPNGGPGPSNSYRPPPRPFGGRGPASAVADPLSDTPHQTYQAHQLARRADRIATEQGGKAGPSTQTPVEIEGIPAKVAPAGPEAPSVISAGPQLIDYRKESAAFVPRGVKKKKATEPEPPAAMETAWVPMATSALGVSVPIVVNTAPVINAAPAVESDSDSDGGGYQLPFAKPAARSAKAAAPSAPSYDPAGTGFAGGGLLGKLSSVLGTGMEAPATKAEAPKPGDDYKDFLAGLDKLS